MLFHSLNHFTFILIPRSTKCLLSYERYYCICVFAYCTLYVRTWNKGKLVSGKLAMH